MLIELNGTSLISGRHSGGGGETAVLVLQAGSHGEPSRHLQNVTEDQEQDEELRQAGAREREREQEQEHQPGSMEHQIQARLLVVDKRLHQAMYNTS